jgi:peroxiredoxin
MIVAGKQAPPIVLLNTDGKRVSVGDLLKKGPVVAAFYKISCPVCQFTLPFLERLHQAYGSERVTIVGISQDDAADTKEFAAEYRITFPSLVDAKGYPVSNDFGITNVPTVFLIAPHGETLVSATGFDKKELENISTQIGKHLSRTAAAVFHPGENVPDYKPG